jgi:hypothetical protein
MSDTKAVVKATFKIIGTQAEIRELFVTLQEGGFLTAPDQMVLQYTVFDEYSAIAMRDRLQEILQENRAVVKDGKKTGVAVTFNQATPKATKKQESEQTYLMNDEEDEDDE